jgi:hypothetical protein
MITSFLLVSILTCAQAPASDPAWIPPPEASPAPATDVESPPQAPAAAAGGITSSPLLVDAWRVETVRVPVPGTFGGTRDEIRVLRADGSAVSVAEGLAASGNTTLMARRAGPTPEAPLGVSNIVQHVSLLGVSVGVVAIAVGFALVGVVLEFVAQTQITTPSVPRVLEYDRILWRNQGVALVLASAIIGFIGVATAVAAGAHWGFLFTQEKAVVDASSVAHLNTTFAWEQDEATTVVNQHNAPSAAR